MCEYADVHMGLMIGLSDLLLLEYLSNREVLAKAMSSFPLPVG